MAPKVSVLPVPLLAWTTRSAPVRPRGMAARCTGEGVWSPHLRRPRTSASESCKSANVRSSSKVTSSDLTRSTRGMGPAARHLRADPCPGCAARRNTAETNVDERRENQNAPTTTTTPQCGARARRAMGLFDDLPSAKRDAPESARDDSPAAKRAAAAATDADRADARSSDATTDRAEPARTDGARDPSVSAKAAPGHAEALERLAAHIANPAKFKRASALAAELMRSGELERRHGKCVFAVLAAAMSPPARALDPRTRFEYRELFAAAKACAAEGVLNAKHTKKLDAFLVYVELANRAFTDDAFEFARFAKDVAARVAALPPYEPKPKPFDETETETETEAHVAFVMRRAECNAALDEWENADATRDALVVAVESARSRYGQRWAQSTVDVLMDKVDALERESARFGPEQSERFRAARDAARAERDARRAGAAAAPAAAASASPPSTATQRRSETRASPRAGESAGRAPGTAGGNPRFDFKKTLKVTQTPRREGRRGKSSLRRRKRRVS